jgi:pimeloyl-[acyl-carrier protein] methyl ester esterase
MREAIAYHGWGFDASFWASWQLWFQHQGIHLQVSDRGYFGSPHQPSFSSTATERLLVTHSYGLHWCPVEQLQQADRLISLGGFEQFHPQEARARRRSQRITKQMIQQFQRSPDLVLQNFWVKTFAPQATEPYWTSEPRQRAHPDLLTRDLVALDQAQLRLTPPNWPAKIVILHGAQDQIIPVLQGQALAESLQQISLTGSQALAVTSLVIANAGHALPLTHATDCQSYLDSWLNE